MSTPTLMAMDFGRDDVGETIKWVRYTDAQAELDRLRAECEGYKADAERYRWLRTVTKPNQYPYWAICPPAPAAAIVSADELDSYVDAEIAAIAEARGRDG